ncbi:tetratricopeptide repeat protein [candidate division WOR-3 bacterium]|nr:tetratricopeptide repeat protein [candidate division WOR-3 bacterium]
MKQLNKYLLVGMSFLLLFLLGCQSQYITAGKIYIEQDNYDEAIKQFKLAVEAEPQNPETHFWLGKAYAYKKQYEEACKNTEKAFSLDPKMIENAKKDQRFNYSIIFYMAGRKHVENKEYDLAVKRIKRSIDLDPKNSASMNLLGFCYIKLEKEDEAEGIYKTAIELVPDNIDTYINFSDFYRMKEKYKEEEGVLRKAKKIIEDPAWFKGADEKVIKNRKKQAAEVYVAFGNNLLKQEKSEEAVKVLTKAIELVPDDKDVNFNYGVALFDLKKYADAIIAFKKVVLLDSSDAEGFNYLGASYIKVEKYNEAIEAFTKVIEIDPENCDAYINRAFAYRELGDTESAYNDAKIGTECKKKKENK